MRLRGTGRRARRAAAALVATAVLALPALSVAPAVAAAGTGTAQAVPVPAAPATDDLPVSVAVTDVAPQVLQPGEDLTVTARLRNEGDEAVERPRASVRIYRYRMSSRDELARWAASGASSPVGDVAATTVLDDPLEPGQQVTVEVTVPASAIGLLRTDDAWGPRGIALDVFDGSSRVGIERTFLLWQSAEDVPATRLGVLAPVVGPATDPASTAASTTAGEDDGEDEHGGPGATGAPEATGSPTPTSSPTGGAGAGSGTDDEGTTDDEGSDAALTALTSAGGRLSRLLQATAEHPSVTWAVDPALVEAAAAGSRADRAWFSSLEDAAGSREVLRLPWADPDLAAIAHAGEPDPDADLLQLAQEVTGSTEDSALWSDARPVLLTADDVPDLVTAARAASSAPGVPLVVGSAALPPLGLAPVGARASVATDGGAVSALVPDATLSALLATPSAVQPGATAATTAQRALAETAVLARAGDDEGVDVLATLPRDWQPSATLTSAALDALEAAPWVDTVGVGELATGTDTASERGALPASSRAGTELTPAWVNALAADWRAAGEFASVVEDPAALLDGLDAALVAPLAVAWRDDPEGRATAVADARREATDRQSGLVAVLNQQFTVISSSAQITVAVRNELDQAARVRVELRPHKGCLDTARSDLTTVPPEQETSVVLTLRASANCDVEVDVSLVSAGGRELATPVQFSARVAPTIESVGSWVIGVLLALALAFGIWRTVRRGQTARRGARVVQDPVTARAAQPPVGTDDEDPDDAPDRPGRQDPS
ncbi:DUF6049 family protein [Cellulomonas sp. C5510]|uniref:DUF6049 family protein n=1 Tax=Cellulomonas sp. C5510 TaxID=2871170 RepID=UPI001C94CE3E|nr:DUF6049 family protein [Cellulomonas sp. C5510]QZN85659.1 DUF6049 family protein [Cellulomonas sp. C5510]